MKDRPEKGNAPGCRSPGASSEEASQAMKGINVGNSTALTIGGTAVRQVGDLYSLNDMHRASGGDAAKRPGEFMRNKQTQDLVQEIENAGISAFESRKGRNGGTYACKELGIAYAAWISAKFHLKVIRVFLAVTAPKAAEPVSALSLTDCGDKTKVSKLLATARKQAAQHLARLEKEIADWELVDDERKVLSMPASQIEEISMRLDRVGKMFHPFSEQFVDILGIKRALRGQHPRIGLKNDGWMEILPAQQPRAQGVAA